MKNTIVRFGLFLCCFFLLLNVNAQKEKPSLRDSLDGAFDVSDYIIDAHGFIPVPYFITEPALGGFGFALAPLFIQKNPPYIDSVDGEIKYTPVEPNITGGLGLYTANNSWMTAAFRRGV